MSITWMIWGYSSKQLYLSEFSIADLINAGYSTEEICTAGYEPKVLYDADFSVEQLRQTGYSAEELRGAGNDLISENNTQDY